MTWLLVLAGGVLTVEFLILLTVILDLMQVLSRLLASLDDLCEPDDESLDASYLMIEGMSGRSYSGEEGNA